MGSEIVRNILLNATTSGFDTVGNTLLELGAELDGVSSKLINFGRESLNTYKDYQYNMQQARIAQATSYGQGTKELDEAMTALDKYAQKWSAETIFHTNDVSNAINIASHAGLDAQRIIASFPHLIGLAQAGGIDLSEAVTMSFKVMKALGKDIGTDLENFVDLWAYAANSSTGTVESFGQTMMKMGSLMRFTGSDEELLSMIGLMHDLGTEGSESATLIRTAMMRLMAPSGVTRKVLESMGMKDVLVNLGLEQNEIEDYMQIMQDFTKTEAFEWLGNKGFTAFNKSIDETGKETTTLKPVLQIFSELSDVLAREAGSVEAIGKNQTTLGILGAVFGTRGIVGALNMINGLNGALDTQTGLLNGAAEGYADYAQQLMMDTLYGDTEIMLSRMEELKRKTGETLEDRVRNVEQFVGNIASYLDGMDTASFDALVAGMTTIAGLGGGLTIAGLAFKLIANLMTPTGAIAATMAAFAAGAAALEQFKEAKFAEGFGLGDLDSRQVMDFVTGLGEDFTAAYTEIEKFNTSMETAVAKYTEVSGTFSTDLLSLVLTGTQITPEQQSSLENLGVNMYKAVVQGITDSKDASLAYWNMLFGGEENAENMDLVKKLVGSGYKDMLDQAATINQDIKAVLMKGFDEGFDESDYNKILDFMRQYNELVARATAEAQREQDFIDQQLLLHKAQTASLADTDALAQEVIGTRDANLAKEQETHLRNLARLQYYYENGIAYNGQVITDAQYQSMVAAANVEHEKRMLEYRAQNDRVLAALWNTQITQSEYGAGYSALSDIADKVVLGVLDQYQARNEWQKASNEGERSKIMEALAFSLEAYGGPEGAISQILEYRRNGMDAEAGRLMRLFTMQMLNSEGFSNFYGVDVKRNSGFLGWLNGDYDFIERDYTSGGTAYGDALSGLLGWDILKSAKDMLSGVNLHDEIYDLFDWGTANDTMIRLSADAMLPTKADLVAKYQEYMAQMGQETPNAEMEVDAMLNAKSVEEYEPPNKYASVFYNAVFGGFTFSGSQSGGGAGRLFADGGRATAPSIFGEGGIPEWAIPEEHTDRTAELLNAARAASGFTWPEILSRYGGLNANANHTPTTIVYSPTINANDVTGVREALNEDKRRMERWLEDKKLHDEIEVYA